VYLDAFVLENGENVVQHVPVEPPVVEGRKVPPFSAEFFNVNAADREWVDRQLTMQPADTFHQRIKLSGGIRQVKNVTFVRATELENSPFGPFYKKAQAGGWRTVAIPCGHDVMLDRPEELTRILVEAAQTEAAAV
jgi:hypothetical protein